MTMKLPSIHPLRFALCLAAAGFGLPCAADDLRSGFIDPPVASRPGAYWCWLNGSITKEQITRDLEEMKAKGMGGAEIWDVEALRNPDQFVPAGPAFMGDESVDLIAHAIQEGTRLGLRLGIVTSSGWNAGGSWVPPHFAGKGLFWSQTGVEGPAQIDVVLPFPKCEHAPKGSDGLPVFRKEVAVLAVPAGKSLADVNAVRNLTGMMDDEGRLRWNAPTGKWMLLRVVCSNHGQQLIVPSPNSRGPMIDFIDPAATEFHMRFMADKILAKLGRKDFRGTAMQYFELDSMELEHGVLWSDDFGARFEEQRGYSPIQYLPLLMDWKLADEDQNGRFHADFKKTISDQLIFSHYVTGSKVLKEYGLDLVAEAGGPGPPIWNSCPVDAIKALGAVDIPRGEFWMGNPKHIFLIKEIASASHVYGKGLVDAEAFTTWRRWIDGPVAHKQLADRALCEGLNHFTIHTFASSPPEAGVPGRAYHAGTDINTTATWWPKARPFMDYLARTSYLLRQGWFVGDVCYYYGDQAPNFYPSHHFVPRKIVRPELGLGYDYDVCSSQVILERMQVRDGRIVLPDGMSYAILTLPDQDAMPLDVLRKITSLVEAGATVVGRKPSRTHALKNAPENDAELRRLADSLWGDCDGDKIKEHRFGKGRVLWGPSWREVLGGMGIGPDFQVMDEARRDDFDYIHRTTDQAEIYFVSNRTMTGKSLDCIFRVPPGRVELWDPLTGGSAAVTAVAADGGSRLRLDLAPAGSVFVVFHKADASQTPPSAEVVFSPAKVTQEVLMIDGPWTLRFPAGWGAPESVVIEQLACWTASADAGVKYFSGTASYETSLIAPESPTGKLWLDLGDLKDVAEVFLNGKSVGVVWTPPYRVPVDGILKPGKNHLKVDVSNLWANRILGDQTMPEGGTYTRTNMSGSLRESPKAPLPSGLFGPVRLVHE
jgi:hypothetical protein